MPIAGYCHECGEWVWVASDLSCPKGHAPSRVNGWYDTETGQPLADDPAPGAAPVATTSGTRTGFLTDLSSAIAANPAYSVAWGPDTDMTVVSNPIDGTWGVGKKRAEYTAALKVSEVDRTVSFWEMLKEQSHGLSFGTFESESYTTVGTTRSGTKHETVIGPRSASWEWGYGTTRAVVEEVAARHGFAVHVVLTRRAATW